MQKHIKNYLEYFGIDDPNTITCEYCKKNRAVDIHHIVFRSAFGKKTKHLQDHINNLCALCRTCHEQAHFRKEPYITKQELQEVHNSNLELGK